MSDRSGLVTGLTIQIRRTDGRTHGAIISSVNPEMKTVTVEWLEKGETKGKEIDMESILALNTHLGITSSHPKSAGNIPKNIQGSGGNWEDEKNINNGEDTALINHVEEDGESHDVFSTDCDNGNVKVRYSDIRSLPHLRSMLSTRASLPGVSKAGRLTSKPIQNSNGLDNKQGPSGERSRGVENIPPPASSTGILSSKGSYISAQGSSSQLSRIQKRSNVVKEVEKLQKNREERRLRQAEKKEEKEALMNVDPGNPNWQFLAMIREYQSSLEFRPLRDTDPVDCHQITVCVRKRPLNKKEILRKEVDVISVPRKDLVVVHEPKSKVDLTKFLENQQFRFDYAFDDTCSNETIYKYTAKPLVQTIFDGGMATCFAYGQTGSGKTHTMGGTFSGKQQDCKKGIYAMVAKDIFANLKSPNYKNLGLVVAASFFEIYTGKVFDLLADKAKLRVLEDGKQQVQIWGLTETVVNTVEEVLHLIQAGNQARTSGQTSANSNSSRSHAVFQITLRTPGSHKVHGKFSLIDLAGNERGADTSSANRVTRMEGAEINKSLLALKECIRALGRKGAYLPFRASALTQVLRDSFIGDKTKTCMIAMISPGMSSCEHSLNTLRYADRVKELAATDPSLEGNDDSVSDVPETDNHTKSDLAALRSMNEAEISADLYNFHEAVSHLQKLEEEMLDQLKNTRDSTNRFLNVQDELVTHTISVDYDQEALARDLHAGIEEHISQVKCLRDKVLAFRKQLIAEEEISKKMTPNPHNRHFQ